MSQQPQESKQSSKFNYLISPIDYYQKLISLIKGIVSELVPFSSNQPIEPKKENEIMDTPIIDANEEELRAVREYQAEKTSRTEYINQKSKKTHSILSITQYITNAKYNSNQEYSYDYSNRKLHNSAFTAINDHSLYSYPSLNQRKEIINCNDFSKNKQLKPLTLLNSKHKRDEDNSEDSDNNDIGIKRTNKVPSISFGNTSFYCKSKYNNTQTENHNKPDDKYYHNDSSLLNNTSVPIDKPKEEDQSTKSPLKEKTLFPCKTPFSFDYLDRKKSLIEYYDNKRKEQERIKDYIMSKDEQRASFTDLLYGRNNSFALEGKSKPIEYQVKQAVALHYDQKPLYLQHPIIKQSSISFEYMKNHTINKDKPVTSLGLFDTCKDQIKKTTQEQIKEDTQPISLFNEYEKGKLFENTQPITTTTGTSPLFDNSGLFNVPKEKQDQYKDAKYESVILNNVSFGVPNKKTDEYLTNKTKKNKNQNERKSKQKIILETSMIYRVTPETKEEKTSGKTIDNKPVIEFMKLQKDNTQSDSIVNTVKHTIQSNKIIENKTESVILDNVSFGVPKDKTDDYIKNQSNIKYESVILKDVVFGAPKEISFTQIDNAKKEQQSKPKDSSQNTMPCLFADNNENDKGKKENDLFSNTSTKTLFPSLFIKDENKESNLLLSKQNESNMFEIKPNERNNINYSTLFDSNSNKGLFSLTSNSEQQPFTSSKPLKSKREKIESKKKRKANDHYPEKTNTDVDTKPLFSFLNNDNVPQIKFTNSLFNLSSSSNDNTTTSSNNNNKSAPLFGFNTTTSNNKGLFNQAKDANTINPFSSFLNKESNS